MSSKVSKPTLLKASIAVSVLLLASGATLAQSVNLTAKPTSTTLPDGQTVPMWGLFCNDPGTGASCAPVNANSVRTPAAWAAETAYAADAVAVDSSGTVAKVSTAGTSDVVANAPTFGTTAGNVTTESTGIAWTTIGTVAQYQAQTATWSPPIIKVAVGSTLSINLTNSLSFGTNKVPTSLMIVGQLGGGLGTNRATMPSPKHDPQGTTWPGTLGGIDPATAAVTVVVGGAGYINPPAVTISGGGGSGATAVATIANGAVTGVSVSNVGSGYTAAPTASIAPPPCVINGTTCVRATATASLAVLQSSDGSATFVPPAQADRVRSFGTEVLVGAPQTLTWANLRAGTYLIESGTEPSIQGPMGLYGVLVVTELPNSSGAAQAYGQAFDSDVAMLLSEIDPVQNATVDTAVRTAGFDDALVWNGQPGKCGDAAVHTCYPPAVNYSPLYYLINGVSFDRTNINASTLAVADAGAQGNLLLRFVNAGLRMHVPSVVGSKMALLAEDGNKLPGIPKQQSEVFLAAGKTYDVAIQPAPASAATTPATYAPATYAVFDRALSLSTGNQRDGGMQAYVKVGSGAAAGAAGSVDSATKAKAYPDTYKFVAGKTLAISDLAKSVVANDVGIYGVALSGAVPPGLILNSNGTFTYSGSASASFTYCGNGATAGDACTTVSLNECTGSCLGDAPSAGNGAFTSIIATRAEIAPPGVLAFVTNDSGFALTAVASSAGTSCASVSVNPDGSFTATPVGSAASCTFKYNVSTSTNQVSANDGTITVNFLSPSNLAVTVKDAKNGVKITDYRWIIEEDKTFWIDPKCQVNTATPHNDSNGKPCPIITADNPVESLGYNFHTAHMDVVAQGCVGAISCEEGQTVGGTAAVCDQGNGMCRTDGDTHRAEVDPKFVHLDSNKRYFISILPGDGVNATIGGAGGAQTINGKDVPFDIARDCGPFDPTKSVWEPGGADSLCGHAMGGAQIAPSQTAVNISLQQSPLPTAKLAVFVFQDDNPLNGENDAGGGVDVIAPNEPGLGGFEIKLFDQAGGLGDNTGQITYDMFNQPVSNSLAGTLDPITGLDACPISARTDRLVGMIPTCPTYESDHRTRSPLAGQVVIANLYPGLYEVQAYPAADRIGRGEEWLQTNTLDGGKPHEAFLKPNEPGYFQEFGPGGYHVSIGFANPKVINDRKAGFCAAGGCTHTLKVQVSNNHMSRTPDQRTFGSGSYDHYGFTQCYVSVGPADSEDFAIEKCKEDGTATFTNMPNGTFKLTVFDQWNDIMLDGLVGTVVVNGDTVKNFPVTQWRTNLYTRTFLDADGNGVSGDDELGLPLVNTNIRYRDGSFGFFNNTDLSGYAGFNEVFPFMNWLVVETSSTRYKPTGIHTVYDAGGQVDGAGGGSSTIASHLANTLERVALPAGLRVPGARYCKTADCATGDVRNAADTGDKSSGAVFPPQPWGVSQGWQGLLGQNTFIEFGMKPFADGENGGINGHVIYASTRPFDDPSLSLQLSWEPGVPRVKVNLYQKIIDANGNEQLKLVDTTTTTSWDDWAQGFRSAGVPNMNCPGQDAGSPFFATLKNSKQWLDKSKTPLQYNSQFKCYDGWSQLNQVQPAPYDGMYKFPSVTAVGATTGKPAGTNCTGCTQTDSDGNPMLPPGKYVVEVVVPPGYELVKEEDKNILLGDVYVAPVTQQFAGFGNVFIMPDQAAVGAAYNGNNPGNLNQTTNLGANPRHEGDTGSIESFWPCVGAKRTVPDLNSLFPGAGQAAPFAGAERNLCDRKEVILQDQASVLAKFYVFSSAHIAGHFTGTITNDFASEFDPFSPQFGEKFGPPNLPVAMRDWAGNEVARVYSDQWGIYNGLYFSSYSVNPPNPTGYVPQMSIACMNDPGPIADPSGAKNSDGTPVMITDPAYNPAYSNFCYETPFMPGFTAYMDTPVIPTQAFADGYNLPDSEYPNNTPAIMSVKGDGTGPWVKASGGSVVQSVAVTNAGSGFVSAPAVVFNNTGTGGADAAGVALLTPTSLASLTVGNPGTGFTGVPSVTFFGTGSGAAATASMGLDSVTIANSGRGSYAAANPPVTVTFSAPECAPNYNATTCIRAVGSVVMTTSGGGGSANSRRRVASITFTGGTNTPGAGYLAPPTVKFSRGTAAASTSLGVRYLSLDAPGTGFTGAPLVGIYGGGGGGATATAALTATSVASVALTNYGSGYTSAPGVTFDNTGTGGSGATATASIAGATGSLTIIALGDKVIQNPNFSGPNASIAPYNQKTITRHYGFGSTAGTVALVDAAGKSHPLTGVSWADAVISGQVPADLPKCSASNSSYKGGNANALCGQLVITSADGKQSIDAITVTVGGNVPWVVTPQGITSAPAGQVVRDYGVNFGRMGASPLQTAIDSASPGDLIIVDKGAYRENLIMWKPVRLQGVGAGSVTVNADAHPAGKMDQWRRQVTCVFGLTIDGVPNLNNAGYDPDGRYSCPNEMHQRVDRIPFEAIVGWDASGNGNLAQVLQEPTLMGAYEGSGITVLGRGVRIPSGSTDFWGVNATGGAGAFTDGSVYLGSGSSDCATSTSTGGRDYGTANFFCNPSRIDGVSIINSSQGGGGVFIHGWGHNLEVANTRISGNHGTLAGGINLGNGETPDAYINDGVECGTALTGNNAVMPCPPIPSGTALNAAIPFQFNTKVRVHHNMIYNNASIGDALFSGTPAGAGAITVSSGADDYQIDHNWMAGNLSTGDGGGVQHLGLSFRGKINNNYILFNQTTNPTLPTNGGGLIVEGANVDRFVNGVECGSVTDIDCPPGLGEGVGPGIVIDANLILGNSAESGSGGGLRIQQTNGSEVAAFPTNNAQWYDVSVTNNIIANNVAGWDGGGVSMQDALKVSFINNTVASNDTTATAGALFKTLGAVNAASAPPGCTNDPTQSQNLTCPSANAPHDPQPAGLVVMAHTPNLVQALAPANIGPTLTCPGNYGYSAATNGDCLKLSKPRMVNNLFWQNRSFRVDIVGPGTGNQSQQNLIALKPQLNQASTGDCPAPNLTDNPFFYWDIGLRTDDIVAGVITTANKLTISNSIVTADPQIVLTPVNAVTTGGTSGLVAKYCNGARMPPEHCTDAGIDNNSASCKGFNAPPGASETTSLSQVFVFDAIQPTATIDEGHNWLNLTYGPLTLGRPSTLASPPTTLGERMVGAASVGLTGAYSINPASPPVGKGLAAGAPDHDFFGSKRQGVIDVGAVQLSSGTSTPPTFPTLSVLDNFNRANANTLGSNWNQLVVAGAAGIRVNGNQAFCINSGLAGILCSAGVGANAYWGAALGTTQAAAFTFTGTILNGNALYLKASGNFALGAYASAIRVRYNAGQVIVETTANGGFNFTTVGTIAGTFAANDTLTAQVDATGTVFVWKTSGTTTTFLGQATAGALFTGTGRIGLYLVRGANVDNFQGL